LSVSTKLDHAGGTSAGGFRTNSIAFGMLPLWTSTRVNDGSFRYRGNTGRSADIAKATQMTRSGHQRPASAGL